MNQTNSLCLHVAALTHVGRRRNRNEDCFAINACIGNTPMSVPWLEVHALEPACVCLVADGMGGHPAGDFASRLAVEHLSALLPDRCRSDDELTGAIRDTNQALFRAMAEVPERYGMGTTLAGIAAHGDTVAVFNVGDSRVYRVRHGRIEQISVDHSEILPAHFFWEFPTRALSQCLGGYPGADEVTPFVARLAAAAGCGFLICSDGLHDMLSDQEIAECLDADLSRCVLRLFDRAMDAGGTDNISIVFARLETG